VEKGRREKAALLHPAQGWSADIYGPGGFRRQDQRPAVMNIDKTAIGGSGHQQKSFGAIPKDFCW
jgi:hypothetical protein